MRLAKSGSLEDGPSISRAGRIDGDERFRLFAKAQNWSQGVPVPNLSPVLLRKTGR